MSRPEAPFSVMRVLWQATALLLSVCAATAIRPLNPRVQLLLNQLQRQQAEKGSKDNCLVTDTAFGAKCDGVTDDTAALQAAIDGCSNTTVALPVGKTCLSHTLALRQQAPAGLVAPHTRAVVSPAFLRPSRCGLSLVPC